MKPVYRRSLLVAALAASCTGFAYLRSPVWIRSYIADHYPGITVDSIDVAWLKREATLHGVHVDRPNLKGTLASVHVDRHKNIEVQGGTLEVTVGSQDEPGGSVGEAHGTIVADGLTVTAHYHDITAELRQTHVDSSEICFGSATVVHPKVHAILTDGCAKRDKSVVTVKHAEFPVELPLDVPHVEHNQKVEVFGLKIEPGIQKLSFDRVWTHWLTVQGPGSAHRVEESVVFDTASIEVSHPWLADHPVHFDKVHITAPASMLKEHRGKVHVQLGAAFLTIDPFERQIEGALMCWDWFDALPKPLPDAMQGMKEHFSGALMFNVQVKPSVVDIKSKCVYECSAEPIASIRKPKFAYEVYNSDDELVRRESGPATDGWVRLGNLPPHVPRAFELLEDPGFAQHRGVLPKALENSLKINLEKGGFLRGGSTITMQLAKNLWLTRGKSIGRKVDEAMLAYALESCLSKEQILEMYLNVIEFGPNLYGIGFAAKHYFKKDASNLTAEEAFYLASILPAPRKALPPSEGGIARAKRLMKSLAKSGFLADYLVNDEEAAPVDTAGWDTSD